MSDSKVRVVLVKGNKVIKDSMRAVKWYAFGNFAGVTLDIKHEGTRVTARCVPDTNYDKPGEAFVVYDLDQGKQILVWENKEAEALIYPPVQVAPAPRTPNPFAPKMLTAMMRADKLQHTVHAGMVSTARIRM